MRTRKKSIRGQAIAELLIALVGLTVAMAAVLQVCRTGDSNIRNLYESRKDAVAKARSATFGSAGDVIGDWNVGDDGLRHTADDEIGAPTHEDLADYVSEIRAPFNITTLDSLGLNDGFTPYVDEFSRARTADLYRGEGSESVPFESALKTFLFIDKEKLDLSDESYMPGMDIDTF
jgi:hypothetical protein